MTAQTIQKSTSKTNQVCVFIDYNIYPDMFNFCLDFIQTHPNLHIFVFADEDCVDVSNVERYDNQEAMNHRVEFINVKKEPEFENSSRHKAIQLCIYDVMRIQTPDLIFVVTEDEHTIDCMIEHGRRYSAFELYIGPDSENLRSEILDRL